MHFRARWVIQATLHVLRLNAWKKERKKVTWILNAWAAWAAWAAWNGVTLRVRQTITTLSWEVLVRSGAKERGMCELILSEWLNSPLTQSSRALITCRILKGQRGQTDHKEQWLWQREGEREGWNTHPESISASRPGTTRQKAGDYKEQPRLTDPVSAPFWSNKLIYIVKDCGNVQM